VAQHGLDVARLHAALHTGGGKGMPGHMAGQAFSQASGLLFDGYNPEPSRRGMGAFVTLEAAQEAAYAHFLQSINDPTQ